MSGYYLFRSKKKQKKKNVVDKELKNKGLDFISSSGNKTFEWNASLLLYRLIKKQRESQHGRRHVVIDTLRCQSIIIYQTLCLVSLVIAKRGKPSVLRVIFLSKRHASMCLHLFRVISFFFSCFWGILDGWWGAAGILDEQDSSDELQSDDGWHGSDGRRAGLRRKGGQR